MVNARVARRPNEEADRPTYCANIVIRHDSFQVEGTKVGRTGASKWLQLGGKQTLKCTPRVLYEISSDGNNKIETAIKIDPTTLHTVKQVTMFSIQQKSAWLLFGAICCTTTRAFAPIQRSFRSVSVVRPMMIEHWDTLDQLLQHQDVLLQSTSHFLADASAAVSDGEKSDWWQSYLNIFTMSLTFVHSVLDQPLRNVGFEQTWGVSIAVFTTCKSIKYVFRWISRRCLTAHTTVQWSEHSWSPYPYSSRPVQNISKV